MEIKQKLQTQKLLVPQLNQSLKILALATADLRALVEEELLNNPCLDEAEAKKETQKIKEPLLSSASSNSSWIEPNLSFISRKPSLQEALNRQLGFYADTDIDLKIGYEIIGNIDDNGYLKAPIDAIAQAVDNPVENVERVLAIIQRFEPAGVGCRSLSECLLIQLSTAKNYDPLLIEIAKSCLDNIAKKNYTQIAKKLNISPERARELAKQIARFNPKPGASYSQEEIQQVFPDVIIEEGAEGLIISILDENIPMLNINKDYKKMLKESKLTEQEKSFIKEKLESAVALLRAVERRKFTLRKIVEAIIEVQEQAIRGGLSHLKPLNFADIANKLDIHESTVCRAVMNKYAKIPAGVIALKDFFPSKVKNTNGEGESSNYAKKLIKELIDAEDKSHPISDKGIADSILKNNNINISRRTVFKYREELKILSSVYRRER